MALETDDGFAVGTPVEVRCRFDQSWATGYSIAGQTEAGYLVRRAGDDLLPVSFPAEDLRLAGAPLVRATPAEQRSVLWPALQPRRST